MPVLMDGVGQTLLAELFPLIVAGFSHSIGVESERIAWVETRIKRIALPLGEQSKNGAGGMKALDLATNGRIWGTLPRAWASCAGT